MNPVKLTTVTGAELKNVIPELAQLRINVFREYPYLYDGTLEYEAKYLQTYSASQSAMAVLVIDGDTIVGASTAIAMLDETVEFKQPFIANNMNPDKVWYCGESVLLPAYRGRGIYKSFFCERENYARDLGEFEMSCFCAVVRDSDHPLQPKTYQPLDAVWSHFGYRSVEGLVTTFAWKDIDQPGTTDHKMQFWIKALT